MAERRICPPEFQEAIDERFGLNRFGGPRFKLAWSETETHTVQGPWGYTERMLCPNIPCWVILRWRAPETFGTPRLYELINRDPETHLCILGEYPYEGKWEIVQPLYSKEFSFEGGLKIDHFPLSWLIIEHILPVLEIADAMTKEELEAVNEANEAAENKTAVEDITNRLMEEYPTRFGPVSYGRGGCKTSVIDRKMHEISKVWNRMSRTALRSQRHGFYSA